MSNRPMYLVYNKSNGKVIDVVPEGVICAGDRYEFANKKYNTMWITKVDYKKMKFYGKK